MICGKMFLQTIANSASTLLATRRVFGVCVAAASTLKFERHWMVDLPRIGREPKLKRRHNIYKVAGIENGPKELAVILTEDSYEFGVKGEMLVLPKHFGRRLIGQNKAVYASPENIEEYTAQSKSSQTLSGRRMLLWLKNHDTFICPFRYDVPWTLTKETLARCFLREHNLNLSPSSLTLPDYSITNDNVDPNKTHEVQITVNESDTVTVKISIPDWTNRQE